MDKYQTPEVAHEESWWRLVRFMALLCSNLKKNIKKNVGRVLTFSLYLTEISMLVRHKSLRYLRGSCFPRFL